MRGELIKINIWGLDINNVDYDDLLCFISDSIETKSRELITYANTATLNKIYKDREAISRLNNFDIVHPDGIGIYGGAKFLNKQNQFKKRITGSDFYPILTEKSIKNNYSIFFFGNTLEILNKIGKYYPGLKISGMQEGYNFKDEDVIEKINSTQTNILIIGLGQFLQEEWILKNEDKIRCNIIIAVGDGIKAFAHSKIRGPKFIRKIGFEWLIRMLFNPLKYWKRYMIGNPLFLVRIIKTKLAKLS